MLWDQKTEAMVLHYKHGINMVWTSPFNTQEIEIRISEPPKIGRVNMRKL